MDEAEYVYITGRNEYVTRWTRQSMYTLPVEMSK